MTIKLVRLNKHLYMFINHFDTSAICFYINPDTSVPVLWQIHILYLESTTSVQCTA